MANISCVYLWDREKEREGEGELYVFIKNVWEKWEGSKQLTLLTVIRFLWGTF